VETLKVGVVGLQRGQGLVNGLATHPRLEISALCDLNQSVLDDLGADFQVPAARRFSNYDDLLQSDVDAIAIATPIGLHAEQSIKALDAGKHVLSEQTQAYTVEDCQAIIDAERRAGRVYMMAENYTYFHYMDEWRAKVAAGSIGELTYAEGEYLHEIADRMIDPSTGERQWRYTRPAIHYCAHALGPILTLMDDEIVRATGLQTGNLRYPDESGEGWADMEVALFQTAKGRIIKVLRSQTVPRYPELVWYSLYGTKGFLESGREGGWGSTNGLHFDPAIRSVEDGAVTIVCDPADPDLPEGAESGGHGTSEYAMVREFVSAIDEGRRAAIDSVRASQFTVPGIIAHQSALQGGEWLDVPQLS
jgi:predicted dehydrogenase